MKPKLFILLICSYLLAISINLMPALKHPDANMNIFNLLSTIFFLIILLIFAKKGSNAKKVNKKLKIISTLGIISGVTVFLIKTFERFMFNYVITDAIAAIQYPLYLIFTTPLFGVNILFDLNYATYSLLMSMFYIFVLIVSFNFKQNEIQSA